MVAIGFIYVWQKLYLVIVFRSVPSTNPQVQSPSIVFVGAVDAIFLGMYRDLMFLFRFKK